MAFVLLHQMAELIQPSDLYSLITACFLLLDLFNGDVVKMNLLKYLKEYLEKGYSLIININIYSAISSFYSR